MSADEERELEARQAEQSSEDNAREDAYESTIETECGPDVVEYQEFPMCVEAAMKEEWWF